MDSDLHHGHQHFQQQQQQQQQMSSGGLTRYRSAPSSYFANLLNSVNFEGDDCDEVFNPRLSSPETDRIFQRFLSGSGGSDQDLAARDNPPPPPPPPQQQRQSSSQPPFVGSMKHEQEDYQSHQQQLQQNQPLIYQNQSQLSHHNSVMASTSAMNDSFIPVSSMAMDRLPPMKMGGGGNLVRQSSSPAGFFSHVNVDNAYSMMRGMGGFGAGSGGAMAESSFPCAKRLKNQMDFSSGPPSSSGLLTRIPEIDVKNMGISNSVDGTLDEIQTKDEAYVSGFGSGSWDDSSILSDNFLKELGDSDRSTFPNMDLAESQNDERRNRPPSALTHHLSLPTSSAEMSSMDKIMMFQDSTPLRIRAKRGCATHPRSIAERVRRTRISERMRKLQDLVPNMDKQTNTSDMLDLAVDYIKDLQKQAEMLSDQRAKCTCSNKQQS